MVTLSKPIEVRFRTIRAKHVDAQAVQGCFIALSQSGAAVRTSAEVVPLENLEMETGDFTGIFGKVLEASDGCFHLRFTAVPPEFQAYVNDRIETQPGERSTQFA